MSSVYSPVSFLRKAFKERALLAQYFATKDVLSDFDFQLMRAADGAGEKDMAGDVPENSFETLLEAWLKVPIEQREDIELDFQEIAGMATERGVAGLVAQASMQGKEGLIAFFLDKKLDSHFARAFWAFNERHQYWDSALRYYHIDRISDSKWRRRSDIGNHKKADTSSTALESFGKQLGAYFKSKEARGEYCIVDYISRVVAGKDGKDKELDYFFANLEDYPQKEPEWVANQQTSEMTSRSRRPVFEAIFAYCQADDTLDIYFKGVAKHWQEMQKIFAQAILHIELPKFERVKESYQLTALERNGLAFVTSAEMGVESVYVKQIRVSMADGRESMLLDAGTEARPKAAYELLERFKEAMPNESLMLKSINVIVSFDSKQSGVKERSFWVSPPHTCGLGQTGQDAVIRQILVDSGIQL